MGSDLYLWEKNDPKGFRKAMYPDVEQLNKKGTDMTNAAGVHGVGDQVGGGSMDADIARKGQTGSIITDGRMRPADFVRDSSQNPTTDFKTIQADPTTFEDAIYRVTREIADLVISKQHDYGHGNILKFGETGIIVRMSDKMERLINLHKKETDMLAKHGMLDQAKNEPKLDSFTDMAGYGIIALMLDKGWFTLELQQDQ